MARFKKIYIEISNICNLQCSFCPVVERDKRIMSFEHFTHALNEAAPLTEEICLHLMGEPLAHPEFPAILEYCAEKKVPVFLTTNGTLISRHQEVLLHNKSLRQINFSFQAEPTPPLEPILHFTQAALQLRPELYINFRLWNMQGSTEHHPKTQELLDQVMRDFNLPALNPHVDVRFKKSKKVTGRLYLHFDSRFIWPSPQLPKISEKGFCYALESHIGIHADGTVVPCCLDKEAIIKLGNIHDDSLETILQTPRAEKMRQGFKAGKLVEDLCQRCPYSRRFVDKN